MAASCANVGTLAHVALSEIHAAPSWLWPALVEAAAAEEWTVERVRKAVAAVKEASDPPFFDMIGTLPHQTANLRLDPTPLDAAAPVEAS